MGQWTWPWKILVWKCQENLEKKSCELPLWPIFFVCCTIPRCSAHLYFRCLSEASFQTASTTSCTQTQHCSSSSLARSGTSRFIEFFMALVSHIFILSRIIIFVDFISSPLLLCWLLSDTLYTSTSTQGSWFRDCVFLYLEYLAISPCFMIMA